MKINKSILFYFGFGGIIPALYFSIYDIYGGRFSIDDPALFIHFFYDLLISYILVLTISWVIFHLLDWFNRVLPWSVNVVKRFIADLMITPIVAVILVLPLSVITFIIYVDNHDFQTHMIHNSVIALFLDLFLVAVYEGVYLFKQWKSSLFLIEKNEKEHAISKFGALKNQINPHFLFNCLNVLSSLIHEDVDKAEEFIDEFSTTYRYMLEHQEKHLVSLSKELEFVHSYFFLQKIRFGENISTDIKIDVEKLDYLMPTMSLQLLVENAIKHNKISSRHPLHIEIYLEKNFIAVKNNLQIREDTKESTGMGLNNLTERLKFLTDVNPEYFISNGSYIGKIPLIKNE